MFRRPPKNYREYLVDVPQAIDWILRTLWDLKKSIGNNSGGHMTIDGGSFTSPNNAFIDGGSFS
jgi:hypothetical protein